MFRAFWGVFRVFWGEFRVFLGCSGFSWECSGFLGGAPGFSVVPECSVMFRCSGDPCSGVPGSTTCPFEPKPGKIFRFCKDLDLDFTLQIC